MILLGLILVGLGIGLFFGFRFSLDNQSMLIAVFILAAILMLLVVIGRVKESVGVIFTALWLVLVGLLARFNLVFPYSDLAVSLMPIAAGAFMMIGL